MYVRPYTRFIGAFVISAPQYDLNTLVNHQTPQFKLYGLIEPAYTHTSQEDAYEEAQHVQRQANAFYMKAYGLTTTTPGLTPSASKSPAAASKSPVAATKTPGFVATPAPPRSKWLRSRRPILKAQQFETLELLFQTFRNKVKGYDHHKYFEFLNRVVREYHHSWKN